VLESHSAKGCFAAMLLAWASVILSLEFQETWREGFSMDSLDLALGKTGALILACCAVLTPLECLRNKDFQDNLKGQVLLGNVAPH